MPILQHVVIQHGFGLFGCRLFENFILQLVEPTEEGAVGGGRAHGLTLTLVPRSSMLEFGRLRADSRQANEVAYQARYARQRQSVVLSDLTYETITVRLSDPNYYTIENTEALDESGERRMALALSLLQGAPVALVEEWNPDTLRINLVGADNHESAHALCRTPQDEREALKLLHAFLRSQTDRAQSWRAAGRWFIEGKSLRAPVEFKCMLLLVFLEAFGRARTLEKREVAQVLDIDEASARFLVEMRNELIHSAKSLDVCVQAVLHKIRSVGGDARPKAFPEAWQARPRPEYVWLRLCGRINATLARDIDLDGGWNNYDLPPTQSPSG